MPIDMEIDDLDEGAENEDRGDDLEPVQPPTEEPSKEPSEEPSQEASEEASKETSEEGDQDPESEEETPETPAQESEQGEEEKPQPKPMIPKYRYDSVASRLKAANAELERLRQGKSPEQETQAQEQTQKLEGQITELDTQYAQAVVDGDHQKAAQFRSQQRQLERQLFQVEQQTTSSQTREQTLDEVRYDSVVSELENTYEAVNPNSETYNQEVVDEILDMRDAYVAKGEPMSIAMKKASTYVLAVHGVGQETEAPAAKPAEKRKTDVKRNVETANRQPPDMGKTGLDSPKAGVKGEPDVDKMSDEEFDALPAATKARMRGDEG